MARGAAPLACAPSPVGAGGGSLLYNGAAGPYSGRMAHLSPLPPERPHMRERGSAEPAACARGAR